jgi:cytochrome c peroxidase
MRKAIILSSLFLISTLCIFLSCHEQPVASPEKIITETLKNQVDSFGLECAALKKVIENSAAPVGQLQGQFLRTRLSYKKIEWASEYFDPATSRFVNGPPVQEVELPELKVTDPAGLQVIEGILFPVPDTARKMELTIQLDLLMASVEKYKKRFRSIVMVDWQVFDAAKLEIYRVMTLGIVGFDNPLTLKSMQESAIAVESVHQALINYQKPENTDGLDEVFIKATGYLLSNPDFDSFDRMNFITGYCNPLTIGISEREQALGIHVIKYNRLLNQAAMTLFDTNAFNVNAYAPDRSAFVSGEKVLLGQKLFSDPVLSGNGKRSCQSCHVPGLAFADGLAKNTVIGSRELLGRNTPTLINAALQPSLFYDLRVNSLEDQSHSVVHSANEMHGSMTLSVQKLWKDAEYRRMFLKAFPYEDSTRIDTFEVMNAIGTYIRSLTSLDSRFDAYMRGNHTTMNAEEVNGFNLFMGKAKCATCHYMPLFNGTFPPRYMKIESEVIGVPETKHGKKIDPDPGRYNIVKLESLKHAFKTPTVRNAARTAPYMHNGVFASLEEVMDFYKKGGGTGLGIKLENQTLPFDSLRISYREQSDIIAFIKCLDSKFSNN